MSGNATELHKYQKEFIDFLVKSNALSFGEFVLKSGRKAPYFINTGKFNDGSKITEVGKFYAAHISAQNFDKIDSVFGPAYKGIPLAVTTASALFEQEDINVGYSFDRKEEKGHGDRGKMVGFQIEDDQNILIVEDVITAGTTLKEVIPVLYKTANVNILGVIISVDRCEKGAGKLSAIAEVAKTLGVQVFPIVNIHEIKAYLSEENNSGFVLSSELQDKITAYLDEYGA